MAKEEAFASVKIPPVEVSINPRKVSAGQTFTVKVTLADFVGPGDRVFLKFSFKRVLFIDGLFSLQGIDHGYFDPDYYASFIELVHPQISGESDLVKVRPDASQPSGYPAVNFPEDLLVTAYVESDPQLHCSQVVRVVAA